MIECSFITMIDYSKRFVKPGDETGIHQRFINNTWEWLESDWTLLTIPQAGHFVQHDAADLVTGTILGWLARR